MRYLSNPTALPRMNAAEMEPFCKIINDDLWGPHADDLCARAAALVEEVAAGNFDSDNIRTQPFTENVIARCKKETETWKKKTKKKSTARKKPRAAATR